MKKFQPSSQTASQFLLQFVVLVVCWAFVYAAPAYAVIRYVKPTATGIGNGSSWANASADLQAMINSSAAGDSVWVAAGTYLPTQDPFGNSSPSDPRDKTFFVKDGVKLYGGFAGTEATLEARNIAANPTTLSGDFNGNDVVTGSGSTLSITSNGENAYHVVIAAAPITSGIGVTIDGFAIMGGNANGTFSIITVNDRSFVREFGGGIYTIGGTNSLNNNVLSGNSAIQDGGGIYTFFGTNSLNNNTVTGNSANSLGGGIFINLGTNTLSNNTLSGNSASNGGGIYTFIGTNTLSNNTLSGNSASNGGGIFIKGSTNTLSNNTLIDNSASYRGGGIFSDTGTNRLSNNTFSGNSATTSGGGIYIFGTATDWVVNNIFWGNTRNGNAATQGADYSRDGTGNRTFVHNLLQLASSNYTTTGYGAYDLGSGAVGNIFAQNPLFVDAANPAGPDGIHRTADDGLRLQVGSPAINAGIATYGSPNIVPATDILGTARPQGSGVDMGAYEWFSTCPIASTLYVDASVGTSGDGTSWATAFQTLSEALATAHCCTDIDTIKVAEGTYLPTHKPFNGCTEMTTADDRDRTFHLPDGIVLLGGYPAGGGTRDISANPTTLSGDFNGNDIVTGSGSTLSIIGNGENTYHVVLASAPSSDGIGVTVDGFTIRGGNANCGGGITVNGNTIPRIYGGGIYTSGGTNTLSNNTLSGNSTNNAGGGIYTVGGTNTLSNNTLSGNSTNNAGGGIYTNSGTNTLSNNTLSGNSAGSGGGIYTLFGTNTLSNNMLSGNSTNNLGGGIYTVGGTNTLSNNTLSGNSAGSGGGIYTNSGTNTLSNNTLSGNSAGSIGGGIFTTGGGTNTLSNNTLSGNSANNGGGIFTTGGCTNTLSNNTISNNTATQDGGGLYMTWGNSTLINNTIFGNSANYGAGFYSFSGSSNNTLSNNAFWGNTANIQGGGIYASNSNNTLINNTFSGNSASDKGGGIVTGAGGTNTLTNNIFWGNLQNGNPATQGADYYRFAGDNTFVHNLLQLPGSSYTTTGTGEYDLGTGAAGNLFAQNPLFVDAANPAGPDGIHRTADDGLRLQAGSPAINSGIATYGSPNIVPATDILGTARPQGSGVDMGAYETACNATANITGAATGCGSVTLTASGGTSYAWSGGDTPNEALNTFTASNTYTVTVTDGIGCTATESILVTVNPLPSAGITNHTGTTVLACNATTEINLSATGGTSYAWSGGATPTTADNSFTTAGEYTVTVTNTEGCTATASIEISGTPLCPDCTGTPGGTALPGTACNDGNANTINDVYDANCSCAGTPVLCNLGATLNGTTNLCAGGVIGLVATGGNQYQWSGPNGYSTTGGSIIRTNATVAMSGTYTVTITNNTCVDILSIDITVHPIPNAAITGATSVCSGGTIGLSVPAGAVGYAWTGPAGFTAATNAISLPNATTGMSGTYKVTVTGAGGCTASGSRTVNVNAPTAAAITGTTAVCAGSTLTLTATTAGVGYAWSGPGGFSFSGAAMTRTPAVAGAYTVTVTNASGCISTASRTVTVNAAPNVVVTNNSNCTRIWLVASGGNSYTWSGPNGYTVFGATVLRNPATASMFGAYTVTVTGTGGCTASASITVNPCSGKTQSLPPDLSLSAYPNPTPGIVHISFTNVEAEEVMLAIYTAEGKEVNTLFTGIAEAYTNYTLRFDGSYLPNGVYYAVLRRAGGGTEQLPIMVVK